MLSIVIPCYNEEKVIDKTFLLLVNILISYGYKSEDLEFLFVIEKSKDNTLQKALKLQEDFSFVKVLENDNKYGKGYSVKRGILAAKGDYILVLDADLPIDLEKYLKIMFELIKGPNSAAVYATAIWDKIDFKKRNFIRSITSLGLLILRRLVLNQDISDSQLGCKLYKAKAVKKVINEVNINGFLYEIVLTDLMFREGYDIEECAVRIDIFSDKSSVRVVDIFSSLFQFFNYALKKRKKVFNPDNDLDSRDSLESKVFSFRKFTASKTYKFFNLIILCIILGLFAPFLQDRVMAVRESYTTTIVEKQNSTFKQDTAKNVITYSGSSSSHPNNPPPGHGGIPPGHGGTPPGHGGTPPGHGGTPPGHGGTPPGQGGTPPGHGGTPPGHGGTPPGRNK